MKKVQVRTLLLVQGCHLFPTTQCFQFWKQISGKKNWNTRNCPIIAPPPSLQKFLVFTVGGVNYWELKRKAICLKKKIILEKKNIFFILFQKTFFFENVLEKKNLEKNKCFRKNIFLAFTRGGGGNYWRISSIVKIWNPVMRTYCSTRMWKLSRKFLVFPAINRNLRPTTGLNKKTLKQNHCIQHRHFYCSFCAKTNEIGIRD